MTVVTNVNSGASTTKDDYHPSFVILQEQEAQNNHLPQSNCAPARPPQAPFLANTAFEAYGLASSGVPEGYDNHELFLLGKQPLPSRAFPSPTSPLHDLFHNKRLRFNGDKFATLRGPLSPPPSSHPSPTDEPWVNAAVSPSPATHNYNLFDSTDTAERKDLSAPCPFGQDDFSLPANMHTASNAPYMANGAYMFVGPAVLHYQQPLASIENGIWTSGAVPPQSTSQNVRSFGSTNDITQQNSLRNASIGEYEVSTHSYPQATSSDASMADYGSFSFEVCGSANQQEHGNDWGACSHARYDGDLAFCHRRIPTPVFEGQENVGLYRDDAAPRHLLGELCLRPDTIEPFRCDTFSSDTVTERGIDEGLGVISFDDPPTVNSGIDNEEYVNIESFVVPADDPATTDNDRFHNSSANTNSLPQTCHTSPPSSSTQRKPRTSNIIRSQTNSAVFHCCLCGTPVARGDNVRNHYFRTKLHKQHVLRAQVKCATAGCKGLRVYPAHSSEHGRKKGAKRGVSPAVVRRLDSIQPVCSAKECHRNEVPCEVPGCPLSFATRNMMRAHMQKAHPDWYA